MMKKKLTTLFRQRSDHKAQRPKQPRSNDAEKSTKLEAPSGTKRKESRRGEVRPKKNVDKMDLDGLDEVLEQLASRSRVLNSLSIIYTNTDVPEATNNSDQLESEHQEETFWQLQSQDLANAKDESQGESSLEQQHYSEDQDQDLMEDILHEQAIAEKQYYPKVQENEDGQEKMEEETELLHPLVHNDDSVEEAFLDGEDEAQDKIDSINDLSKTITALPSISHVSNPDRYVVWRAESKEQDHSGIDDCIAVKLAPSHSSYVSEPDRYFVSDRSEASKIVFHPGPDTLPWTAKRVVYDTESESGTELSVDSSYNFEFEETFSMTSQPSGIRRTRARRFPSTKLAHYLARDDDGSSVSESLDSAGSLELLLEFCGHNEPSDADSFTSDRKNEYPLPEYEHGVLSFVRNGMCF